MTSVCAQVKATGINNLVKLPLIVPETRLFFLLKIHYNFYRKRSSTQSHASDLAASLLCRTIVQMSPALSIIPPKATEYFVSACLPGLEAKDELRELYIQAD